MNNSISSVSFNSRNISQAERFVKHPIKFIFSDIDGTIMGAQQRLLDSDLLGLQKLEQAQIPLIIATGRGYKELDYFFNRFHMHPQTAIAESGAVVIDSNKNKLYENQLSMDNVTKIREAFNELKAKDTYFRLTFDGEPYIEGSAEAFQKDPFKTNSVSSFDELLDRGMLPTRAMIAKFDSKSFGDIEALLSKFRAILGSGLDVTNSNTRHAEITNSSVSKAGGIKFLQKLLGFDFKNTACIGDAANDICMSDLVSKNGGMSVSMGNGTEALKNASDFVTDSIDNGGFSRFADTVLKINSNLG